MVHENLISKHLKMGRGKAIAKYCRECVSDSPKEVTLCHLFNCPLWPYRFGVGARYGSQVYEKRMKQAMDRYPGEMKELRDMGINTLNFLKKPRKTGADEKNSRKMMQSKGIP